MRTNNELVLVPQIVEARPKMNLIRRNFIEDETVVLEETDETAGKEHPNFIESNTTGITLKELEDQCIVPSFGDNQLIISHQIFIRRVEEAARHRFIGEKFGSTEIRVSHKILGRVPSALHKKKEELRPEDETVYYQRMAFCLHVKTMARMMNGQEAGLRMPYLIRARFVQEPHSSVPLRPFPKI